MLEYEELRIRAWKTGRRRYLVFANGPAAAAAAIHLEKSPQDYWEELNDLLQEDFGRRPTDPENTTRNRARKLGRELFEAFLPDPIRRCVDECLELANRGNKGLRLRFDVAPELADIPFELLHSSATDPLGAAALTSSISPVRSLSGKPPPRLRLPQPDDEHAPMPLLIIAPAPRGREPLDVAGEIGQIRSALPLFLEQIEFEPLDVLGWPDSAPRATFTNVGQLFTKHGVNPCVALLIAHGEYDCEENEIFVSFEQEDGDADKVPGERLAGLLAQAPGLRLVVLNICLGAKSAPGEPFSGLAKALVAEGIPAVVAMQTEVTDQAAAAFSSAFFGAIYQNKTVDEAVLAGRLKMAPTRQTKIEWCNPVLFLHHDCGDTWLFKVPELLADGEEMPDPIRQGFEIVERTRKTPTIEGFVDAARFLRKREEWEKVSAYARSLLAKKTREAPEYTRLLLEANTELHSAGCWALCDHLAGEHEPQDVKPQLESLKTVLDQRVYRCFAKEVEEAIKLDQLCKNATNAEEQEEWAYAAQRYDEVLKRRAEGYRDAIERLAYARGRHEEKEGRWSEALDAYQRLDPKYEDIEQRLPYAQGRVAEKDGQWEQAISIYEDLQPYADTANRLAYAQVRGAAQRKEWVNALKALRPLPKKYEDLPQWRRTALQHLDKASRAAEKDQRWQEALDIYPYLEGRKGIRKRLGYARGRAAEQGQKWPEAVKAYSARELGDYLDAAQRLTYAQARAAEDEGHWADAVGFYDHLDKDHQDVRERRPYASGRQAERDENWQGVVDGFGSLPDSYREGDVGLRRRYARARHAAEQGEWAQVAEALDEMPEDYRDGDAGRLRHYAQARSAEGEQDWNAAVTAYAVLSDKYRDVAPRREYARGRRAQAIPDWQEAVAAFESLRDEALPDELRQDVAYRRPYARGRLAEEQGDWATAVAAYGRIEAAYEDGIERLSYVKAREAECGKDWQGVLDALKNLGAETHVEMRRYAAGRLAEQEENWQAAVEDFEVCGPYLDAAERRIAAHGRLHEAAGNWRLALDAYCRLQAPGQELGQRRERLEALLTAAPWADGLARAALSADPLAVRDGVQPYEALRQAGVTPSSPAEMVMNASFALMERGAMTPEARLAWDQMRSLVGRLQVDAFLYRLHDPEGLQQVQRRLAPGPPAEVLEAMCRVLPADAPLFRLLDNRRDQAIEAWEADLEKSPHEVAVVHALALAHLWRAKELEASGAYEQAERGWECAIGYWARLLSDDSYWDRWRKDRAVRYQQMVTQGNVARLRSELGQRLLNDLSGFAERCAAQGRRERAESYRDLVLALEVELEGARVLKEVGGLPLDETNGRRLVGGVLYLHRAGLGSRLARMIARLEAEAGEKAEPDDIRTALDIALGTGEPADPSPSIAPETLFRLRCAFSGLGRALILLERHQPEQGIRALPALYQKKLTELDADCEGYARPEYSEQTHSPSCSHCEGFLRSHPAYLHLPHRGSRLLQDAVALATRAHLELAQTALRTHRDGLEEVLEHWREAIAVARNAGAQVRTKRAIVRVVIGRADALAEERGRERGKRLTGAIHLIDQARRLIGGADAGELSAKAAEMLTDRGVWYGYGCHEYQDPDYGKAASDLRSALELTPDSLHARDNLSRALIFQAANMLHEGGSQRALELFAEAILVLHEGLLRTAGHRQLRDVLRQALDELEEWVLYELSAKDLARRISEATGAATGAGQGAAGSRARQLAAVADQKLAQGDVTDALITLIEAVRCDDGDPAIRRKLIDAVERKAHP